MAYVKITLLFLTVICLDQVSGNHHCQCGTDVMHQPAQDLCDTSKMKRKMDLLFEGNCKVYYNGKCYVVRTTPQRIDVAGSWAECNKVGGVPGNIYSEDHFDKVSYLMREQMRNGWTYHHIWTGMLVDQTARTLLFSDGTTNPSPIWYANRPFTETRRYVGMHLDILSTDRAPGVFDENVTRTLLGVLCEIPV